MLLQLSGALVAPNHLRAERRGAKYVVISMLTATEVDEVLACSKKLRAGRSKKLIIIVQSGGGEAN